MSQHFLLKSNRSQVLLWLGLSLLVSLLYSYPALKEVFRAPYVLQDDARQHVFWMRRFLDPALFPNDLMADYFQSVAPKGYAAFYRLFAIVGIDPILLNKLLPTILGLVTTVFCFGVAMQILPLPIAGFAAATLLNQNLWMRDDLSSATPGAFFYPIFLAFLYYLLRRSLIPCVAAIALLGLFYPQSIFLASGILILRLVDWQNGGLQILRERSQIRFSLVGLATAFLVMLFYALQSSEFGPVIRLAEAKPMAAFSPTGWSAFFTPDPIEFWFCGKRSGMIPTEWCELAQDDQDVLAPWRAFLWFPSLWLGLLLPIALIGKQVFPLANQVTENWKVLLQALLVSIGIFFLAHLLAFKLHLPNRYTEHSFRILLALAAGISFVILWDTLIRLILRWLPQGLSGMGERSIAIGFTAVLIATLVWYPFRLEIDHRPFPVTGYFKGQHADLYEFFAKQPKDIVIASLTEEANQLPTFSQRSLFVGGEGYILPYHRKYYQQISQKLLALIQAQYSPDLAQVKQFIRQSQINFWLIDGESFQPNFANPKAYLTRLFEQFPQETEAIKAQLQTGYTPALTQAIESCSVFKEKELKVLRAKCILRQ